MCVCVFTCVCVCSCVCVGAYGCLCVCVLCLRLFLRVCSRMCAMSKQGEQRSLTMLHICSTLLVMLVGLLSREGSCILAARTTMGWIVSKEIASANLEVAVNDYTLLRFLRFCGFAILDCTVQQVSIGYQSETAYLTSPHRRILSFKAPEPRFGRPQSACALLCGDEPQRRAVCGLPDDPGASEMACRLVRLSTSA